MTAHCVISRHPGSSSGRPRAHSSPQRAFRLRSRHDADASTMKRWRGLLLLLLMLAVVVLFRRLSGPAPGHPALVVAHRLPPPEDEGEDEASAPVPEAPLRFQPLCHDGDCLWAFGAFADPRSKRLVRVTAVGARRWAHVPVFCSFEPRAGATQGVPREAVIFHTLTRAAKPDVDGFTIKCRAPAGKPPSHVTLSLSRHSRSGPRLAVVAVPRRAARGHSVAACLAPLHGLGPSAAPLLLEWFEYQRLAGVSLVLAYNWSVADAGCGRVLAHYAAEGFLRVLPWRPPVPVDAQGGWPPVRDRLHYFGQFSAHNDCLYRLLNRFRWLLFVDLDEFVVARGGEPLPALLARLARRRPRAHVFLFRSADFDVDAAPEPLGAAAGLRVLNWTRRAAPRPPNQRSKVAVDASTRGESMGVHKLFSLCPGAADRVCFLDDGYETVPPSEALLHHYRHLGGKARGLVRDDAMAAVAPQLSDRVQRLRRRLLGTG